MVFQSLLGGGPHSYRYTPGPFKIIDDYPSCNLLVRKSTFQRAGGFGTEYWPGEDTKLCLSITKELGESIVYVPNALVYHHRRNLFRGHVNQVKSYALHRGYFVKRYPETSRRFNYFLPSFLLVGIVIGLPLLLVPTVGNIYLAGIAAYLALIAISTAMVSWRNVKFFPLVGLGTVMTQLVYGAWFLKGLFTRNMSH
jgi:GT2 family glycosyltransferase